MIYEPEKEHDYSAEKPEMLEISEDHLIFASKTEAERYCKLYEEESRTELYPQMDMT